MSKFIDDCINADALIEEIDDYVEQWHNSDSKDPIYEYLGMTEEEYFLWLECDSLLKYVIVAHEKNMNINDVLQDAYTNKMVARSNSPEEAKEIYNWLVDKGKLNG